MLVLWFISPDIKPQINPIIIPKKESWLSLFTWGATLIYHLLWQKKMCSFGAWGHFKIQNAHNFMKTLGWFGKVITNLLLRTCYCYYCSKQGMVFQDVTFYLRVRQTKRLSCTIFLTADRWNLSKCRLLTTLMLQMQVPNHMGNF